MRFDDLLQNSVIYKFLNEKNDTYFCRGLRDGCESCWDTGDVCCSSRVKLELLEFVVGREASEGI